MLTIVVADCYYAVFAGQLGKSSTTVLAAVAHREVRLCNGAVLQAC
jgi:hypothetical protein